MTYILDYPVELACLSVRESSRVWLNLLHIVIIIIIVYYAEPEAAHRIVKVHKIT